MAGMGKTYRGHGFSPIPAGLQKPATGIVPIVFASVQCVFARCRRMEENVHGLLFFPWS